MKISRHATGGWYARVELPRGVGGERRRKSVYGKTRAEVAAKAAKIQAAAPADPSVDGVTVAAFLDRWLLQAKQRLSPTTWARYELAIRLHLKPHLGNRKLAKLRPADVAWCYQQHAAAGLSEANSRKAANVLSKALGDAAQMKLIPSNPAAGVPEAEAQADRDAMSICEAD